MQISIPPATRPDHVPEERVRDFNIYEASTVDEDWQLHIRDLIQGPGIPDVFWTPQNGGHWVAGRAAVAREVLSNAEHFSASRIVVIREMNPDPPFVPLQIDPPNHTKYRNLLAPALSPGAVQTLGEDARALAVELIEGFKPRGECEFIGDFATHLPIAIFMSMTDLPAADRPSLLDIAHGLLRGTSAEERAEAATNLAAYAQGKIDERRANPGKDLISQLTQATVDDAALDNATLLGMVTLLMLAGLDTVASMMTFFARFLALNPAYRHQLIAAPETVGAAVEELLRRHPIASPAREVICDCTLGGAHLRAGDMVLVPTVAYGLDDRQYEQPEVVDFDRRNKIHETFGDGVHRCLGAMLARIELRVFLEEWLQRIPDFAIKPGTAIHTDSSSVAAIRHLPLVWKVK